MMATEILQSFSHLQSELEEAKSSLKGVDQKLKGLTGRDPSDLPRPAQKRQLDDKIGRSPYPKYSRSFENDDVSKRRQSNNMSSVFKRLSEKVPEEPEQPVSKGIISKVIAAPKEVPSRQEVLDKQNKDEKFKARNRRMFGALLGTLQKFQQEETKLKQKEEKRTQIEKKIEEHEQQEKEEIKKERQELFMDRKKKRREIKMIELKMLRLKEYAVWEEAQKPRTNFILTKAKPHIQYLPRKMNDKSKEHLAKSKKDVEDEIATRKAAVSQELSAIDDKIKNKFKPNNRAEAEEEEEEIKEEKPSIDRHNRRGSESDLEDDGDYKMKSMSPEFKQEIDEEKPTITQNDEYGDAELQKPTNCEEVKHSEFIATVQSDQSKSIDASENGETVDSSNVEGDEQSSKLSSANVNQIETGTGSIGNDGI